MFLHIQFPKALQFSYPGIYIVTNGKYSAYSVWLQQSEGKVAAYCEDINIYPVGFNLT